MDALAGRTFLVTGATGNLGAAIVRYLLNETSANVRALVRPQSRNLLVFGLTETALWPSPRLLIVAGDITVPRCGVSPDQLPGITDIVHCAAEVRWRASPDALLAANVDGVGNLCDLAAQLDRSSPLRHLTCVSTAYVQPRRISSRRVAPATAYETSKILAERVAASRDLPITIVRPSTLVGESGTGRIETFNGAYFLLRMLVSRKVGFFPGYADALADLVAVDDAARAIINVHRRSDLIKLVSIVQGRRARRLCDIWADAAERLDARVPVAKARKPGWFVPPEPARALLAFAGRVAASDHLLNLASFVPYVARREPLPEAGGVELALTPVEALLQPMADFALAAGFQATRHRMAESNGA